MKVLFKIFISALIAILPLTAYANNDEPVFKVKTIEEKTIAFEMKAMAQENVEISIENAKGDTLFSEYVVRPTTFERLYNLESLSNGEYFIRVQYGTNTQLLPIKLTAKGIKLDFGDLVSI
jgi:hypothetical protein